MLCRGQVCGLPERGPAGAGRGAQSRLVDPPHRHDDKRRDEPAHQHVGQEMPAEGDAQRAGRDRVDHRRARPRRPGTAAARAGPGRSSRRPTPLRRRRRRSSSQQAPSKRFQGRNSWSPPNSRTCTGRGRCEWSFRPRLTIRPEPTVRLAARKISARPDGAGILPVKPPRRPGQRQRAEQPERRQPQNVARHPRRAARDPRSRRSRRRSASRRDRAPARARTRAPTAASATKRAMRIRTGRA